MSKDIRLHPEHGLNPMMLQCHLCGGDAGIALLGYNKGKEAPRSGAVPGHVCRTCEGHMKIGIILIETRDGESGDNPYRTGRQWVVKEDAIKKICDPVTAKDIIKSRVSFIPESAVKHTRLDQIEPTMGHV